MNELYKTIRVSLLGPKNAENTRLFEVLKQLVDPVLLSRQGQPREVIEFSATSEHFPVVVFVDLLSFDLVHVTQVIENIRTMYPVVTFVLYIEPNLYQRTKNQLPGVWATRFEHYLKVYKNQVDGFADSVASELQIAQFVAVSNFLRFAVSQHPVVPEKPGNSLSNHTQPQQQVFISYSREDWDSFVASLAVRLRMNGFAIWVDQEFIAGGDDWMDNVSKALDESAVMVLIMSPDAMKSRYVRMEYRYFFNKDKPIIPILYKRVEQIPPELFTTQYIDFTHYDAMIAYSHLFQAMRRYIGPNQA